MARLIVDSRESQSRLASMLAANGADVEVQELEVGDYVLADGLAVERKSAVDFINSVVDRRIFLQLANLKSSYTRAFIVVEGDLFKTRSAIAPEALLGAMSYISVIESVPILWTPDVAATATLLATMQRHALEGLGYEIALRGGKPKDRSAGASFLLEGLPGIGPAAARKLLSHFGTPSAVMHATREELRACAGIGPKTVDSIFEVMHFDARAPKG